MNLACKRLLRLNFWSVKLFATPSASFSAYCCGSSRSMDSRSPVSRLLCCEESNSSKKEAVSQTFGECNSRDINRNICRRGRKCIRTALLKSVFGAGFAIRPDIPQRVGSQGFSLKLLPMDVVDAEGLDLEQVGEDKTSGKEQ